MNAEPGERPDTSDAAPNLPPASDPDVPTHRRTVVIDAFEREGEIEVVGHLTDHRPWATGTEWRDTVHEMELRITVRRSDLTITDARAEMSTIPHPECADIEPAFEGLVGLNVARGYTKAVQQRFGRHLGCSHLEFLARNLGPVVIQALGSSNNRAHARGEDLPDGPADGPGRGATWLTNTCHIWSDGGIGEQLMDLGWRPGPNEFPAPSLVELRRRKAAEEGGPTPAG